MSAIAIGIDYRGRLPIQRIGVCHHITGRIDHVDQLVRVVIDIDGFVAPTVFHMDWLPVDVVLEACFEYQCAIINLPADELVYSIIVVGGCDISSASINHLLDQVAAVIISIRGHHPHGVRLLKDPVHLVIDIGSRIMPARPDHQARIAGRIKLAIRLGQILPTVIPNDLG